MKKVSLVLIILLTASFASFAQQKRYGTKTIGQWIFEKFPLHYSVTPAKTMYYKNRLTGRLEFYKELNQLGQEDGLSLAMSADGIYPSNASYTYKGQMIYSVTFFPNSKIASNIIEYDSNGLFDGYKIYRTLKSSGGYIEEIEKYENNVLVEINGIKQMPVSSIYKDSLLSGKFKFVSEKGTFEGEAENGKLKNIKHTVDKYFISEIIFSKDSIINKTQSQSGEGFVFTKRPLISNPIITNSKLFCKKYGNLNGYPYYIFPQNFELGYLEEIVTKKFPEPFETKVNYLDSLLDGNFQYREYIGSPNSITGYIDVVGTAEKGKLINLSTRIVDFLVYSGEQTSEKTIKYIFLNDKITQNDYLSQLTEPVSTTEVKIEYPVLLTNSKKLGGEFSFRNRFGDSYSINGEYNILGVPFEREGNLENNQYGYVYFSPFTFDISNLIKIVRIKNNKEPLE